MGVRTAPVTPILLGESIGDTNPKDPSVLKTVRRVNFGTGTKFGTDVAKRYGNSSQKCLFF